MRKKLFLVSGLLAATLFTACNNEEITMPQGDNEAGQVETEGGQELVIALADGSLNMGRSSNAFARAAVEPGTIGDAGAINDFGRPLFSSMAARVRSEYQDLLCENSSDQGKKVKLIVS